MWTLVFDAERARVRPCSERREDWRQVHVSSPELAEFRFSEALEVHVAHVRAERVEGRHGGHAVSLEVDRIEIHADVRPIHELQNLAANLRTTGGAIVIFEDEGEIAMII